jgi:hypothetical protein
MLVAPSLATRGCANLFPARPFEAFRIFVLKCANDPVAILIIVFPKSPLSSCSRLLECISMTGDEESSGGTNQDAKHSSAHHSRVRCNPSCTERKFHTSFALVAVRPCGTLLASESSLRTRVRSLFSTLGALGTCWGPFLWVGQKEVF